MGRPLVFTLLFHPTLSLNTAKTEIVHFSRHALPEESVDLYSRPDHSDEEGVSVCGGVKILSSKKSVEENINEARRAFFALGTIKLFQGKCNPLTARCLFFTFVLPILFYGCESWFLIDPFMTMLETFQAEIGKWILKLPHSHNNISVCVGLKWPSFVVTILLQKLTLLAKLVSNTSDM